MPRSMTRSTVLLTSARACLRAGPCAVLTLGLSAAAAGAAEGSQAGASDVVFLAQLITLMLVGRLLGEVMRPAVGHGNAARRHRAWPLGAGRAVARLAARHLSERARAESHARWHRTVRHSPAAAADRDGDRPQAR